MTHATVSQPDTPADHVPQALLNRLYALPFDQFADCICELLRALGYIAPKPLGRRHFKGGNRSGGSADLIAHKLVDGELVPILILLKKFKRSIQKRFLYELRGRMVTSKIKFGLVITTSTFRPGSILVASQAPFAPINLMDGATLAKRLICHGIGVQPISVPSHRIDEGYFANLAPQP